MDNMDVCDNLSQALRPNKCRGFSDLGEHTDLSCSGPPDRNFSQTKNRHASCFQASSSSCVYWDIRFDSYDSFWIRIRYNRTHSRLSKGNTVGFCSFKCPPSFWGTLRDSILQESSLTVIFFKLRYGYG